MKKQMVVFILAVLSVSIMKAHRARSEAYLTEIRSMKEAYQKALAKFKALKPGKRYDVSFNSVTAMQGKELQAGDTIGLFSEGHGTWGKWCSLSNRDDNVLVYVGGMGSWRSSHYRFGVQQLSKRMPITITCSSVPRGGASMHRGVTTGAAAEYQDVKTPEIQTRTATFTIVP